MIRRSRLSVRPNVKPGGRVAAAPASQHDGDGGSAGSGSGTQPELVPSAGEPPTQNRGAGSQDSPEQEAATAAAGGGSRDEKTVNDAGGSTKPLVTAVQRRKRIAAAPNLAKPRDSRPSVQRSDVAAPSSSQEPAPDPLPSSSPPIQNVLPRPEKASPEASPKSPTKAVPSLGQGHGLPEKRTPVPQVPHFSPFNKSARKELNVGTNAEKGNGVPQKDMLSPLKERPTQEGSAPGKIPVCPLPAPAKKIQRGSDRERILKAQKLRELLREELKKERKMWREKHPMYEGNMPLDRSKMVMRDFIYYLPDSNPMKSSLTEEKVAEKSPPVPVTVKEPEGKSTPSEPELEEDEAVEEEEEEDGEGSLLVPRVKVAEDGSIILDEESLTVEVLRTKGPAVVEENDPIFERGSTTTYSSFRKCCYTKPWSNRETDMFFLAISMVGTDFSMIGQLFPHRARTEIKNKFKREERSNGWRIDKAFKDKQPFDFEFFAQLLEKVLAEEKKRKQKSAKIKNPRVKKPTKFRRKQKAKAVCEETDISSSDPGIAGTSDTEAAEVDARTAEKENEVSPHVREGQAAAEPSPARRKRKKKKKNVVPSEPESETPSEGTGVSPKPTNKEKLRSKTEEAAAVQETGDADSPTGSWKESEHLSEEEALLVAFLGPEESQHDLPDGEETENGSKVHSSASKQGSLSEPDELLVPEIWESSGLQTLPPSKSQLEKSTKKNSRGVRADTCGAKNEDVCDETSPAEDSSAAGRSREAQENEKGIADKPARAVRGSLRKPKRILVKASGKTEAASHPKPTEGADKDAGEVDVLNVTVEEPAEKKNEDLDIDEQANKTSISPEENKQSSVRPAQLPRGRSQRPKPNLRRAAGRKEVAVAERAAEEGSTEEGTLQEDNGHRSLPSLNYKPNQVEEIQPACSSLGEFSLTNFGGAHIPQKDEPTIANLEHEIQANENSSLEDYVHKETIEEPFRSDEEPGSPGKRNQDALKSVRLTRSRFNRSKPNLGRAAESKDAPVAEKGAAERKTEVEQAEEIMPEHAGNCTSLSSPDPTGPAQEQSPFLLDDSKYTDLTQKGKGSNSLQSPQRTHVSLGKPEPGEMAEVENVLELAATEHLRSDEELERTEVDAQKPGQLTRGRMQRPKPNLGRAARRKEVQLAEKETVEKSEVEESGTLDDGSGCTLIPTSHVSQREEYGPLLSSMSSVKNDLTDFVQAEVPPKNAWSENAQPHEKLMEPQHQVDQKDHTVEPAIEVSPKSSEQPSPQGKSKLAAVKLSPLPRGRFQRPKPNLGRAAGRKGPVAEKDSVEERTEAETTVKLSETSCSSDPALDGPAKCEEGLVSPVAETVDSKQVTLTPTSSKSPSNVLGLKDREFTEDAPSTNEQTQDFGAVVQTSIKPIPQEESTVDIIQPAKLVRGRFSRPKPNLGRTVVRKEVPSAETKNETENLISSALPDTGSDTLQSTRHILPNEKEDLLCETSKGRSSESDASTEHGGDSDLSSLSQGQSETTGKFNSQEERKQVTIKPALLAKGRFQKPKPNLGTAASRRGTPERGKHISENKMETRILEEEPVQHNITSRELPLLALGTSTEKMPLSSYVCKRKDPEDSVEMGSLKRSRRSSKPQPQAWPSENETSTEQEEDVPTSNAQEPAPDKPARLERSYKQPGPVKAAPASSSSSSASKSEADPCEKGKTPRRPKLHIPKGRGSKSSHSRKSRRGPKTTLVTLRALQEVDEDDVEDSEQESEEESCSLPPEEVNKAPVFVPRSLRSPNPVPAEVEETVEEFEIAVDIIDADCIPDTEYNPGVHEEIVLDGGNQNASIEVASCMASYAAPEEETENDGSTEAAMTLLAMGDPMFQSRMNIQGTTFVFNDRGELTDVTPALLEQCDVAPDMAPTSQASSSSTIDGELSPSKQEDQGPSAEKIATMVVDTTEEVMSEVRTPSSDHSVPRGEFMKPRPNLDRALGKPKSLTEADQIDPQVQNDVEGKPLGSTIQDPDKTTWSSVPLHESGSSNTYATQIVGNDRLPEPVQEMQEAKTENSSSLGSPRIQTSQPESDSALYRSSEEVLPAEDIDLFANSSCTFNLEQVMSKEQNSEAMQYQNAIASTDQTAAVDLVANDYPKEEETIILTLVEIPTVPIDGYHDSGAALPLGSEHLLLAPVFISPLNTGLTEGQSTESMTAALEKYTSTSANQLSPSEFQMATSMMSTCELNPISRKRIACDPEESDMPPAKKSQPFFTKQDPKEIDQEERGNQQGHAFELQVSEETPLESASIQNHESKYSELQFSKDETAATSEGISEVTSQEKQLTSLQSSDALQLRVTSADGNEDAHHNLATGTCSRTHHEEQNFKSEQDPVTTGLKQSCKSSVSTASSSRVTLTRPGRRPRGFLSLICKKSSSVNEKDTKSNSSRIQKPRVPVPKPCLKSRTSTSENDVKVSCPPPASIMSTEGDSHMCKDTSGPSTAVSRDEGHEEAISGGQDSESGAEPTSVSEYFFSDIFMEVDELG
ncbi:transcription factor TFIIIB component B'' homolog isoform X2 [Rhinatrema bivittatum]|uniref:transcription factor TFIIIB component B'' homolog isoform X2 n=1 Tax=Rhinatrema bivittatum TaxID=194408 RepID=UPI001126EFB0|nr:transcription factor TFIIIB component B'' homolog isoform X2 [Rhinatrema bivittatum]